MKESDIKNNFSKNFLWGAAVSSHQVEGGNYNQWSVWELENAKVKSVQAEYRYGGLESWDKIKNQAINPSNYVSGKLANHFENYRDDFDFLKKMHMNAFRFSIEWSRIEPREGEFNQRAIDYYKKYLEKLRSLDIEPIVTLFHFSLPVWFMENGGFEKRANIKYFVRYSEKIISEIGSTARYIITINEPEIYALSSYYHQDWPPAKSNLLKAILVLWHQSIAHKKIARIIHKKSRRFKVSIAKSASYFYPGDDSIISRASANIMKFLHDNLIMLGYKRHCDFLGVNFYQSNRVLGCRVHNPEGPESDLGWYMCPSDIEFVLENYYEKYKLPIFITENGLADSLDENRKWWISETILAMQKSIKKGVNLIGYLHWSLMDNFEWSHGKWPRFGLVEVAYKTNELKLRPSAIWFGGVIKKLRGE